MSANIDPRQLNSLPCIVLNLWKISNGTFNNLYCRVNGKEMSAKEMFFRSEGNVFVKLDCLPLDPDVKAAFVNLGNGKSRGRIYVETTLVDFPKVTARLHEVSGRNTRIAVNGRRFFLDGAPFIQTRSQHHFGKITSPRTVMWQLVNLNQDSLSQYMEVVDLIYGMNCFVEKAKPKLANSGDDPRTMEMAQQQIMSQEMRQLIVQEQRPLMAMNQFAMARLCQRQKLLRMGREDLTKQVEKEIEENPVLEAK